MSDYPILVAEYACYTYFLESNDSGLVVLPREVRACPKGIWPVRVDDSSGRSRPRTLRELTDEAIRRGADAIVLSKDRPTRNYLFVEFKGGSAQGLKEIYKPFSEEHIVGARKPKVKRRKS